MKKIIGLLQNIFHTHKWSSCSEDLVDDIGCFEYEATCIKCNTKRILGGVLTPYALSELQFKRKNV